MNLPAPFPIRRLVSASLLVVGLALPVAVRAAVHDQDDGARLLQAARPAGLLVRQADCDHVVGAVRAATLAHHRSAESILSAALASGDGGDRRTSGAKWTCPCVVRIFRTAVNSAPDHASALLETAEALYPDCANGLTEALHRLDDKNVVVGALQTSRTDPKDAGAAYGPDGASNAGEAGAPGSAATAGNPDGSGDPGDPNSPTPSGLSSRNFQGLDLANPGTGDTAGSVGANPTASGFGGGFGAGFPGSPGFAGSTASGGAALPLPAATAVTPSANG